MLKFVHEKYRISEGIKDGVYDRRGFQLGKSGRRYPSKYLLVKLLKPIVEKELRTLVGTIDLWSCRDYDANKETITLEIVYKIKDKRGRKPAATTTTATKTKTKTGRHKRKGRKKKVRK